MSPVTPKAELVLAWAVEVVIKELPPEDADEAVNRIATGDLDAVRAARRLAAGDLDDDDPRQHEVDAMLFGDDARLDDVEEGRRQVDVVLARIEAQLSDRS